MSKKDSTITQERLREVLKYCPASGLISWRIKLCKKVVVGSVAGYKDSSTGYIKVQIDGRMYLAHRLAFLYVRGVWPDGDIDHKNGCRSDNSLDNLRDIDHAGNIQNTKLVRNNGKSSMYVGVSKRSDTGKFQAYITTAGRRKVIGCFESEVDAANAHLAAKRTMHHGNLL